MNYQALIDPLEVSDYLTIDSLYFVLLSYLLLYTAKKINDIIQYRILLDEELLEKDNKAQAVSFSGYLLGVGIILYTVLNTPTSQYWLAILGGNVIITDTVDTVSWGLVGILLLNFSRFINDKGILPHFKNRDEIIRDQNVGTGIVQFGSYVASALIISSVITQGTERGFLMDVVVVIGFFLLVQVLLILFSKVYALVLNYSLHKEIEDDNEAAGITFGLNLVAMGIFLSHPLRITENLLVLLVWFVNGVVFLILSKVLFNKIILHKSDIRHEIVNDRNWGVAILEGVVAIIVAYVVNASLL